MRVSSVAGPFAGITVLLLLLDACSAQRPSAAQVQFFEAKIRPALVKYCYQCHSVEAGDSRAGLLLDSREGLLEGGDAGPALVPGNVEASLLWEAITWESYEMPPSEKMPDSVIADFQKWIEMGAPDPRDREVLEFKTKITDEDIQRGRQEHWAFQPPRRQVGNSIDRLVQSKLDHADLKPARPADAYTLLRRLSFDLIGLPPTPVEIAKFKSDFEANPDQAIKAKVDALLRTPQYGERWGRHWLDAVRYAESSGSRNVSYPHAWRYRNYVIDSFNDDTPYDRFIAEQVAGDLLPVETDEQWQENLIATGFLAIGLKHHDEKNPRKFMADMVDEQIDTLTQSVLGLTVACARCHDHKSDPIPTDDYYALAGIFHSTKTYYGTSRIAQNHRPSDLLLLPIQERSPSGVRAEQSMDSMRERIAELDRQMRGVKGKDRRNLRNVRNRIATQLAELNPDGTKKSFGMGVQEGAQMVSANILVAGEVDRPAQEVPRGFVRVLGELNFTVDSSKSSGRMELVRALTSKKNPLTARVMVNRIWMHLLGKPLVETPSNFGASGMRPTNQELLDYLAVRFMEGGWSIKRMIREIVLSNTYRRSSQYIDINYAVDPDNKTLWRANPRQLDAEALRDSMLAIAGRLDFDRPNASAVASGGGQPGAGASDENSNYRSVYLSIVRDGVPASLDLFDFPDTNMSSPGRSESIVPTQALYLMNGDFVTSQAQSMAVALEKQFKTQGDQVRNAFLWSFGRPATNAELQAAAQFFRDFETTPAMRPSNTDRVAAPRGRGIRSVSGLGARGSRDEGFSSRGRGGLRATSGSTRPVISDQPLAVFCQTLMASARFRILN